MRLHISLKSGVPIYVQVVMQIRQMITSGRLPVGTELPTIRGLAEELLINPNTVARAYRELESAGFVTSRRGIGTVVNEHGFQLEQGERMSILCDRIDALLAEAEHLGFDFDQIMEQMQARYRQRLQNRGTEPESGIQEDLENE
ncbi:MAG TPA: GntR family transcriptional regulator [Candidatus Hydrogenedentes bacterium]|nr:GntR family transcriptional regulator [Candidatus Hydrogenedentota bacterium]